MAGDPFGTAVLRERVLAGWRAAPDRFREDANAEEELALGGYRDRLVVELAQNAADAAARAAAPGRLLLRLAEGPDGATLVAANTGAPLDAAGVRALASLRASAKRGDVPAVGRFGVGFAAVLAVTDEPVVVSHGRGVRFSRADTRALLREAAADVPGLAVEMERRDGHVPALRLPFEADGAAPAGYDTAVLLPLRDGAARDLVERLLGEVGDPLLLALPALSEVVVEVPGRPARTITDPSARWITLRRNGSHDPELLADRPTEERSRTGWNITWALPRDPATTVPAVLHAPTPTDEPMAWPALLVATFPLEHTRRHVAEGPASEALAAACAAAYTDLLREQAAAGADVLRLVPTGLPAGRLDAALREQVLALLPTAPVLRTVEDGALVRPRDAVALEAPAGDDEQVLRVLGQVLAGLVRAPRAAGPALAALGVPRIALADLVDQLPADPDPAAWRRRYAALAHLAADPAAREALAALPVPLADGRVVRGVRGLLLPGPGVAGEALAGLSAAGLRVVHPDVVADEQAAGLLERLGARAVGPVAVLEDPAVARAVADDEDGAATEAALSLVAAAVRDGAGGPWPDWLADLPLPAADGEPAPAGALVLPGSTVAGLLHPDDVLEVSAETLRRWGAEVLEAVGVAGSLPLLRVGQVDLEDLPDALADLDGADRWAQDVGPGSAEEVLAVRDLDLVREDAWASALRHLAASPGLRAALVEPLLVRRPDGSTARVPAYTAWWLRRRLGLAGHADPDADSAVAAALPPAPELAQGLDPGTRRALGLVRDLGDLDADGWARMLAALVEREVSAGTVLGVLTVLARAAADGAIGDLEPPARLRVPQADGTAVTAGAGDVAVADAPMWWQRTDLGPLLPAPAGTATALADLLDLDLASERAGGRVDGECPGDGAGDVPAGVRLLLAQAPPSWCEHEDLSVDGEPVEWWVDGNGPDAVVHATTLAGLARGLAQAAGRWGRRQAVEEVLTAPDRASAVAAEEAFG